MAQQRKRTGHQDGVVLSRRSLSTRRSQKNGDGPGIVLVALLAVASCGRFGYDGANQVQPDGNAGDTDGAPPTAACGAVDVSTVALYTMEDVAGPTVADATGVHDASISGDAASLPGPPGCGNAFQFDESSYLEVPNSTAFDLSEGAIDFWVYLPPVLPNMGAGLISRDEGNNDTSGHLSMWASEAGEIITRSQTDEGLENIDCSDAQPREQWLHVGYNFGPVDNRLYIDGVEQSRDIIINIVNSDRDCTENNPTLGTGGNTNPLVIGASSQRSDPGLATPIRAPFNGAMDEVRLSSSNQAF
jgi:hypothetical protein